MMKRAVIEGVGHYVPTKVVTNHDLSKLMDTNDEWIVQRTGIKERRYIEHTGIGASDLGVKAAQMALEKAGITAKDIDAIILGTLSPDVFFPGSGVFVQDKLGCNPIPALDIRNQCSGFLYGLQIADSFIRTETYKRILLIGAEVHSTGLDFSDRGRDVTVLFGDGAGAVVVGAADGQGTRADRGVLGTRCASDGSGAKDLLCYGPASQEIPRMSQAMLDSGSWFATMNGKQVFKWATEKMPEIAEQVMKDVGVTAADIDWFVPHQANLRINQLVARRLEIPEEKCWNNIERYGNTTAATIPIGLSELVNSGKAKPGQLVLSAAFGSGFTWAASVVRL